MTKRDRLQELLREVQQESGVVQEIMDTILSQYTTELDAMVSRVQDVVCAIRNNAIDDYGDDNLELDIIEISALMYYASRELAYLGGQSDLAKAKRQERYNKAIMHVTGTVAEKKAKVEQVVATEQALEDIYKRAYDQLKTKLDLADKVYSALKKVYHKRMVELEVLRKEVQPKEREEYGE